jgi:SAM-dependent methyltransferase
MVEMARSHHPAIEFREGNAQELPFDDASFDRVAMNFGAPHLSRPEEAFAEAARVLVRGGRYAYTTWAKPELNALFRIVDGAVKAHANLDVDIPEGPPFYRLAEAEMVKPALQAAGFDPLTFRLDNVTVEWTIPSTDFFFEAERFGGVRTAAILARQDPSRLEAIRVAFAQGLEPYRCPKGFKIPATGHVVSAAKP